MTEKTRSDKYAEADRDVEIGATSGADHADLLMRQLGHDEGLSLATGVSYQKPLIIGEEPTLPKGSVGPAAASEPGTPRD